LKLLSYLGYRPNFAGCIGCGKSSEKAAFAGNGGALFYDFSPERGGLVCNTCQIPGEYYIRLHSDRLKEIYGLQIASLAEAAKMKIGFDETDEIIMLLTGFLKYQTDSRELNSLKFLEKLKKTKL
jgi:recombinational DNA repair protein (RecF pathway)